MHDAIETNAKKNKSSFALGIIILKCACVSKNSNKMVSQIKKNKSKFNNFLTNYLKYYKVVSALNISGKNVPTIKISLSWKKLPTICSLPRKFAKLFIRF